MRPRCIMKPQKAPARPPIEDGAALLVDADARADIALAHQIAAADRGAEGRAGVLLDQDACRPACSRAHDQPTRPVMWMFGPSIRPQPK